jgi:hypothetical protein
MPGFVEMALAAQKDDAMAQQGLADRGHRLGRQIDKRTPWTSAPIAGVIGRTSWAASDIRE